MQVIDLHLYLKFRSSTGVFQTFCQKKPTTSFLNKWNIGRNGLIIVSPALILARTFTMLKTMTKNKNKIYTSILISFLRSWSHMPQSATMNKLKKNRNIRKNISFRMTLQLLFIFFIIKQFAQINVFKIVQLLLIQESFLLKITSFGFMTS